MKDIRELNLTYDERIELLLALNSRINELEQRIETDKVFNVSNEDAKDSINLLGNDDRKNTFT